MDEHVDAWFAREILAHEEALVRYLQRCWPHADDIHDLRQEAYIRVYEAARREHALAKAAQERIRAAEQRGFDKARNQALSIVLNERKNWSKDLVRDVLGKVSEAIVYMQKEG